MTRSHRMYRLLWLSLGVWVLTACGGHSLPYNLQMLGNVHNSPLPGNTFAVIVPIYNGGQQPSASTRLQISFHYSTDSNGGSFQCSEFAQPTECTRPRKCTRDVTIPVPALAVNAHWDTPAVPISDAQGPCACIKDHCQGVAELRLVVNNPLPPTPNERLCNTYLSYSWRVDGGDAGVVGFKNDKRDCFGDL
jgi:hypothetical protein